jgi:general secretion pathway protein N
MKIRLLFIVGFIATYFLFLLVLLPASFISRWIEYPPNITVGNVSGSIWHSHIDKLGINDVILDDLDIELSFFSLLLFNPAIDINFGNDLGQDPKGFATISGGLDTLTIEQLKLTVQAQLVAQQLPLPIAVDAYNTIDMNIDRFVIGKPLCSELSGNIVWRDASVAALDEQVSLGRIATNMSCQQGKIVLVIDPVNNLGVSFTATITENFKTSGRGYLSVVETTPEAVQQILPFLGEPDRQGRYVLGF